MSFEWLPSYEKRKKRRRLLSPEAYERTREKVMGPEQVSDDMERNGDVAELALYLELEPKVQEKLKKDVENSLATMGFAGMFGSAENVDPSTVAMVEEGKFTLSADADTESGQPTLAVVPEGNVSEKIPMKFSLSEQFFSQIATDDQV